jgi:hypothetical protein
MAGRRLVHSDGNGLFRIRMDFSGLTFRVYREDPVLCGFRYQRSVEGDLGPVGRSPSRR